MMKFKGAFSILIAVITLAGLPGCSNKGESVNLPAQTSQTSNSSIASKSTTSEGATYVPVKNKFFVLGTYVQPPHMFATWKGRGINTLVEPPDGQNLEEWNTAAVQNQLYMIRPPRSNPALDANQEYLLAWAHEDEPSNVYPGATGVDYNTVNTTPAEIDAIASQWRSALPTGVEIPIYLNLTGGHLTDQFINETIMRDYVDSESTDLIAHDYYTINSKQPMIYLQDGYVSTRQGHAIDRLTNFSRGKPQYSFIESSDYNNDGTLPTAAQMRAQIWSSVIHGAVGIIYFPVVLSPWSWDGTPATLVEEMKASHQKIKSLESTLLDLATGLPRGQLHKMAQAGAVPSADMMPYPFEARTIPTSQGTFYIILNLSPLGAATLNHSPFGISNMAFEPYEVKMGYIEDVTPPPPPPPPPPPESDTQTALGDLVPKTPVDSDTASIELGVKFRSSVEGEIRAIRFYRGTGPSTNVTVSLWSATGTRMGTATGGSGTVPGYITVNFATPIKVLANTTYVASYLARNGRYAADERGLKNAISNGNLTLLAGSSSGGNGVYRYGTGGVFPKKSFRNTNYYVDVVFAPSTAKPPPPLLQNALGNQVPATDVASDTAAVELGVKFQTAKAGKVHSVRLYRGAQPSTGLVVNLWDSSGARLATATGGTGTVPGYITVNFVEPVSISANTTYIASYHAGSGAYAYTSGGLADAITSGDITLLAGSLNGGNGVYRYGTGGVVPTQSYNNTNYFVDIFFEARDIVSPPPPPPPPPPPDDVLNLPRVPWENGSAYWSKFKYANEAGWSNPSFFPIVVWYNQFSSDSEVQWDKSLGINTYIGLNQWTDFALIPKYNMFYIGAAANSTFDASSKNWVGNFLDDEVDGRYTPSEGRALLQSLVDKYAGNGRFNYANFTQMVISGYMNQGDAQAYVNNFTDAVSIDMYWYTVPFCDWTPYQGLTYIIPIYLSNCRTASSYGKSMAMLRKQDAVDGKLQPLWQFVENLSGSPAEGPYRTLSAGQVKGAVMSSIINEARGIVYFNTSFGGDCPAQPVIRRAQVEGTKFCGWDQVMAMGEINNLIHSLAPVINTQSYVFNFGTGLETMVKVYAGQAYIFAMVDGESQPGSRTFTLPSGIKGSAVEVVGEGRTLPISSGKFTDNFAAEYSFHIYKIAL